MTCDSCPHTDGCCYTSMPPQVKCNITGEYHHYSYECDCKEELIEGKAEELKNLKELLSKPGALMMAVNYDSDKAPAVAITGEEAAIAYESLLNLPLYGECEGNDGVSVIPKVTNIDEDAEAWKLTAPVEYGATSCLVCGEIIGINTLFGDRRKICTSCQKTIKFIKERFKEELDNYEV